jgi:hypothetical protein
MFPDQDPYPTLMSISQLTGRENLTTYACLLGPGGHTDEGNQVKMNKKISFTYITSLKQ